MKSTAYIAEITTLKNEKYLSEGRNPLVYSPTHLLALCQLKNFTREFTEKCFAVFDQSSRAIYKVASTFWGIFFYHSFCGMYSRL